MKTLILLVMSFLLVTACDDATTTNNNTNVKKISASINGNAFNASNILITEGFGTHLKTLIIFGTDGIDSLSIYLYFEPFDSIKTGTYNITKDGYFIALYNHSGITDTASEGTVKLEKYLGQNPVKASGTFNFVIKNNNNTIYSITNGVFNSGD